jgi:hypothetical protein
MAKTVVGHAKVLAWGGSIGLRISKAEAKRLGIKVGQEFLFTPAKPAGIDWSKMPVIHDGRGRLDHDKILGQALLEEAEQRRRQASREDEA